jgi:hypothetical protein
VRPRPEAMAAGTFEMRRATQGIRTLDLLFTKQLL